MVPRAVEPSAVTLRDGQRVTLTALTGADDADVAQLLGTLKDPRAKFFARAAAPPTPGSARAALVARTTSGRLAGFAAWIGEDSARGEFAGAVDPRFAGLGLGTVLLRRGARDALDAGLLTLRVELHPGSAAIAEMLRDSGLRTRWDLDYPVVHVDLALGTQRPGWVTP